MAEKLAPAGKSAAQTARDEREHAEAMHEPGWPDVAKRSESIQAFAYTSGVSPINGQPVTFVPGEALPEWAVELLEAGRYERDANGMYRLALPTKPSEKRSR